jgi:KDO2-lipid IV(A) lauroyltransferase
VKDAPVLHRIEYTAYLGFRGLVRALPHRAVRPLGRPLGDLAWLVDGRHRRVALDNVAGALPELDAGERGRLVRRCFRHFGSAALDALSSTRFDLVELCRHLTLEGWEHVEESEARDRGVFLLSAHLGYWEIAAYPPGIYGGPLHVVGRPLDNPLLDRELARLRSRFGNELIAKHGAARRMVRAIRERDRVGILIDQRVPPTEAIEVEFFGRPALTSPLLARLSLRTGAPVVPIFGYGEPRGRYRVVARPPIEAGEVVGRTDGDDGEAVHTLTREYLRVTEEEILNAPEQWLWMHRRWRGAGERPLPPSQREA